MCSSSNFTISTCPLEQANIIAVKPSFVCILHSVLILSKSIIFDATHSSIKKRNEYIEFSKKYSYEVKCIHATTSLDESYKRNKLRSDEKVVPKIAYSVYKKYYQEPTEEEGFVLYKID